MNIGDLVTHRHLGGTGIIVDKAIRTSNITMGSTEKMVVKWFHSPNNNPDGSYFPLFLEVIQVSDKNCPP